VKTKGKALEELFANGLEIGGLRKKIGKVPHEPRRPTRPELILVSAA